MKKVPIFFILLLSGLFSSVFAQEGFFSWSVGSSEMNLSFVDIEVMDDLSVVAVAASDGSSYLGQFLQSDGEAVSLSISEGGTAVIKFSPEGKVQWFHATGEKICQVEINEAGEMVLLVQLTDTYASYYLDEEELDDEEAEESEHAQLLTSAPQLGLRLVEVGAHLVHLNAQGTLLRSHHIPYSTRSNWQIATSRHI